MAFQLKNGDAVSSIAKVSMNKNGSSQADRIDNIGMRGFTMRKQKKK